MPKRYNLEPVPVVVEDAHAPAVMPGEAYDFSDEQLKAGITGNWSKEDPRKGLNAEREFKREQLAAAETPQGSK